MPSIEDQLSQALRRTADTFDNDSQYLAGAGLARGRALRRRRTAAIAAGTTVLAVTGVTAALLTPSGGGPATEATPATGGRTAAGATASRTPGGGGVSAARMLALFKALLPEGTTSGEQARGLDEVDVPYAQAVFDDGDGAAQVSVSLSRQTPGENSDGATRCPDRNFVPYDECTRTTLAGGAVLLVVKGYEYPDKRVDTKLWTATVTAPDGRQVQAMEWNAPAEKGAAVTRPDPPLDAARLKSLVTSSTWNSVLDRIPAPKAPAPTSASATASSADDDYPAIMATARSLLPKGMKAGVPADPPISYLLIDDGKGESYLQIDYQHWKPGDLQDVFADATTLPDGTQVVVRQGASEKGGSGAVTWIVDTMRPDGLRVVLTELNAPGWHQAASRTEPPLTIAQLKAMALNQAWEKLR